MKRRTFLQQSSLATAGFFMNRHPLGFAGDFPVVRIPESQRRFKSASVEKAIAEIRQNIGNKEIAWLFGNCFPNTLDTTVDFEIAGGKPDTYVITGDIDAMWLRDSSAQVWPYLPLTKEDRGLQHLIAGVIRRQTICILRDPYANAFYKDPHKISEWKETDVTDMKPGIHERKWEIDSLCYPIRLAHGYWKETGDVSAFDADWLNAMKTVVKTFRDQQRKNGPGPYHFQRKTIFATDSIPMGGYGYPTRKTGLIHSMFRPSDDATIFPFLIPSNYFALKSLKDLAELLSFLTQKSLIRGGELPAAIRSLTDDLTGALKQYGIFDHPVLGRVHPYETDGFNNFTFMDDANVPSLLSLPYLGAVDAKDPVYQNTRRHLLSTGNPFFFKGKAGEGIGGPHVGQDMIWPLGIIMRGLTSSDDHEIKLCLDMLQKSHAGTGFMHESFYKDDVSRYSRKWFAWANTLFGEFVWKTYKERPHLLA